MGMYDDRFKSLGMLFLLIIFGLVLTRCGASVRDSEVYEAEVDFVRAASSDSVDGFKALIDEYCVCEEGSFRSEICSEAAETAVVIDARMGYHLDYMLFLGGISEEQPSTDPPEIPEATSLCPGSVDIEVPMRLPDELSDAGFADHSDAGTSE